MSHTCFQCSFRHYRHQRISFTLSKFLHCSQFSCNLFILKKTYFVGYIGVGVYISVSICTFLVSTIYQLQNGPISSKFHTNIYQQAKMCITYFCAIAWKEAGGWGVVITMSVLIHLLVHLSVDIYPICSSMKTAYFNATPYKHCLESKYMRILLQFLNKEWFGRFHFNLILIPAKTWDWRYLISTFFCFICRDMQERRFKRSENLVQIKRFFFLSSSFLLLFH